MKINLDVFNRFSGAVQFTAKIEYRETDSTALRLGLAVKWAHKTGANLDGANLDGADLDGANLVGVNLDGANLIRASLVGATLVGTSLVGARLDGARLDGTRLADADLGAQWIIQGATRSDGYAFFLQRLTHDKEPMVKAGCRYFTLAKAEAHWTATRGQTRLGMETEIIVRSMVNLAHVRGLK